jgi:polyisoprenoid-binding protein YceI
MKTFLLCLLILGHAEVNSSVISYTKLGGVSVLTVDPATSMIGWKAEKTTGTHTGTIKIHSGSLTFRCKQLASGWVLIDMKTLNVTDLSDPDKRKLENNLNGDNFFDTDSFPLARIDIVSVNNKSESNYHFITISGNLTLHGIIKRIVFSADVSKSSTESFMAQTDIVINGRDFGIATSNIKYNTFIDKAIHIHVLLQANNKLNDQITSL